MGDHIIANIHDFKSNISKYIRLLERGAYKAVIVRRYGKPVGAFVTMNARGKAATEKAGLVRNAGPAAEKSFGAMLSLLAACGPGAGPHSEAGPESGASCAEGPHPPSPENLGTN